MIISSIFFNLEQKIYETWSKRKHKYNTHFITALFILYSKFYFNKSNHKIYIFLLFEMEIQTFQNRHFKKILHLIFF